MVRGLSGLDAWLEGNKVLPVLKPLEIPDDVKDESGELNAECKEVCRLWLCRAPRHGHVALWVGGWVGGGGRAGGRVGGWMNSGEFVTREHVELEAVRMHACVHKWGPSTRANHVRLRTCMSLLSHTLQS